MKRTALLASALLAACTTGEAGARGEAPAYESIAFEIKSWGRPIDSWEVHSDGTASHIKLVQDEGAPFTTYRLEHRAFTVAAADYARLAAIAADIPRPAPTQDKCELFATDMPYGTLRLSAGEASQAVNFNVGCQDAPYQAFVRQLRAMDELVTGWAEQHPAARVEQIGGS